LLHTQVLALEKAVEADYGPMRETLERELFPVEKTFLESRPKLEADFTALYAKDKKKALEMLNTYVATAFDQVTGLYKKLLAKQPEP
jgi:hypothetical protein